MEDRVTVSAPGKLILFGEHAVVYGYPLIVTAVDRRMKVGVSRNGGNCFRIEAPDLGLTKYTKNMAELGEKKLPKEVRFVEILYKLFLEKYPQKEGVNLETKCEFSCSFGFGSSSAVTVAFAKALTYLYGIELTKKQLFDLCYDTVLEVQGVGSGFDIASAIWGGTIYYIPPAKVVRAINTTKLQIVVGYTGIKADTPTLVRKVASLRLEKTESINKVFKNIAKITQSALEAIKAEDWEKAGKLMSQNQEQLRKLNVSSVELEKLIEAAEKAGAYGAKLSGAGGGDCMIALVDGGKSFVNRAIENAGGEVMDVRLGAEGVKIEEDLRFRSKDA